jgi:ribosomal protein S18 acetylase RimI-like enzyme
MNASKIEVISLSRGDLPAAVEVLCQAFKADPVVVYFFEVSHASHARSVAELYRLSCEVRLLLGWPLLGTLDEDGVLSGVAGLSLPGEHHWPAELAAVYEEFKACVGLESTARLEEYSRLADVHRPPLPHYQLGMIGVHPRAQGKGHASAMIRRLHRMSQADPESIGVWLDTENPRNVPIYQHLGYRIVAQEQLGPVTIWGMFRPNTPA